MKVFPALVFAAFASTALAQDAAAPQMRGSVPAAPAAAETPSNPTPATTDPLGLIPETMEPVAKPKGKALTESSSSSGEQKIDKTTAAADELNAKIKMRELKTKVERDPKVVAELERANTAKTDFEKRDALRNYYKLLYGKIEKLDPSLKKEATTISARLIHNLEQTRIAPTENPDPNEYARPQ